MKNADTQKFTAKKYPARIVWIILFGCFCLFPITDFAKTLTAYREKLNDAKILTENLLYPDVEDVAFEKYLRFERESLARIRADLPTKEKIEWQNSSIETNNQWLADKLDDFEREPHNSPKREAILSEISERLDALEREIKQLETAAASERSKDEDKRKLAEILRREEFQKPEEKQESIFQKFYQRIIEWLSQSFPRPDLPDAPQGNFQSFSFFLQMFLYALILGVIGFLIYRFAPFLVNRFRQREKRETNDRIILGERLAATETPQNLFAEAEQLALNGNLRGAIRKGYIALLCDLSDRKAIRLSRHKTNRDYLKDVRKQIELHQNLSSLTSNFEQYWYGLNDPEQTDWENFRAGYKNTISAKY